jgi:hypothetical protein
MVVAGAFAKQAVGVMGPGLRQDDEKQIGL